MAFPGWTRWKIARWRSYLPRIDSAEPELAALDEHQLRQRSLALRHRAKCGESADQLVVEAFALAREAGRRALGMRHFDVQLLGALAMQQGAIIEMQTGEGKTLTATLPMVLHALSGRGAHLATVNDYLARRDAEWMQPLYSLLGLSVGILQSGMPETQRRSAYACDVTYGSGKEFGFDFLRDRLALRRRQTESADWLEAAMSSQPSIKDEPMQRPPYFILVDEADSVLIDDAGTPLVISSATNQIDPQAACYRWAASVAQQFEAQRDYTSEVATHHLELTAEGRRLVRTLVKPPELASYGLPALYDFAEQAVMVAKFFQRDRHYVVREEKVEIVDEFTGRIAEGRKWRDGIHQAIEAREQLPITAAGGQAARVTVQDFFRRYERLAGMTGTAASSAGELTAIYRTPVVPIPTHNPPIRQQWPVRVFGTSEQKYAAIVEEVVEQHALGRPVLIGTRSIDKSERLSRLLQAAGLAHQVLNARHEAQEAEIVARAGERGKVTVATNMAGRGTDIRLGPGVEELGGLHVIGTEMHDSARVDRQLIGRCGRQGDSGSWRQYLALDDDILLYGLGRAAAEKYVRLGRSAQGSLERYATLFVKAQRRIERQKFSNRRLLLFQESARQRQQLDMGLDPYLDTPS